MEDLVIIRVHLVAQTNGVAVDLDAAFGDQLLCRAAAAVALVRKHLLDALLCQ